MSAAKKLNILNKAKMSAAKKGRTHSEESKAKIGNQKGKGLFLKRLKRKCLLQKKVIKIG
jgi:hypothetical protein